MTGGSRYCSNWERNGIVTKFIQSCFLLFFPRGHVGGMFCRFEQSCCKVSELLRGSICGLVFFFLSFFYGWGRRLYAMNGDCYNLTSAPNFFIACFVHVNFQWNGSWWQWKGNIVLLLERIHSDAGFLKEGSSNTAQIRLLKRRSHLCVIP
jgi:hypothetical protein